MSNTIKCIDLFAGIGGMRLGLEQACKSLGIKSKCALTYIRNKIYSYSSLSNKFSQNKILGDITKISSQQIPDFDILLAGFPYEPFSNAGTRQGFLDTRGTLFLEIERILRDKLPF
jgi:DNA (cytosine-5)-methyltransferase 1